MIDPQRDVVLYITQARELGETITHILQTQFHADFISGHMDLAQKTEATIYAPESANCTVGMDRIVGYLDGGMMSWATGGGHRTADIHLVSAE